jgi:hypothetical protein
VPKKDALAIEAELVGRSSLLKIEIRRFSPPPLPLPLPAISFKGLTYKQVVSPYTKKVWLDRNLGAEKVARKLLKASSTFLTPAPVVSASSVFQLGISKPNGQVPIFLAGSSL